ncbi:MAG: cytoplasmic protein [Deltaproteobacteria bacterium]|nr:cytoplasmic protein [Deltaproteobacteria bacterium]MBW1961764.1 cytoplasmic protein [Deltaproteobacteria bacterium]MBW1994071.1 cytoplasmic protein [Deltaproteobacteria bacterium]MBW2152186.1 cytoplasmic protein [Deltaproteobacteria bacterium]
MHKNSLGFQNPLRLLTQRTEEILPPGGFGAILARAGVGKTSFLIQISLDYLLRGKNVLHISLNDPVEKVCIWYEEVFRNISANWSRSQQKMARDKMFQHRFIMTFTKEGFTVPVLEERLTDITQQNVFSPQILMMDGFPFHARSDIHLYGLKKLLKKNSLCSWFTVRTHRHEAPGPNGMPPSLGKASDLFEVAIELKPSGSEIHINPLKGCEHGPGGGELLLDPASLMIKNKASSTIYYLN